MDARRTGEHEVGLVDIGMQVAVFVKTSRRSIQGTSVSEGVVAVGGLVRRGEMLQAMDTYLLVTATGKGTRLMVMILDSEKKIQSEKQEYRALSDD